MILRNDYSISALINKNLYWFIRSKKAWKFLILALIWSKVKFKIFGLSLLIQIPIFWIWPYISRNLHWEFRFLALLRSNLAFQIFGLWLKLIIKSKFKFLGFGLITVQIEFRHFWTWPYSGHKWKSEFRFLAFLWSGLKLKNFSLCLI